MRTTEAARYARWSLLAAASLAVIVAGVYGYRAWHAHQTKKQAPPPVPVAVERQSAEFSFSRIEKNQKIFTIRASRATEFKEGKKSLLEDVWITVYGRRGDRFDNLHTQACDYQPDRERFVCTGEVRIDLESAEEARAPIRSGRMRPSEQAISVVTSNVSFDSKTGEARTDQRVLFRWPDGEGGATGLVYRARHGRLELTREVELTLKTSLLAAAGAGQGSEPLKLASTKLRFSRDDRAIRLAGVQARQGARELDAGELAIELDTQLRARRLVVAGAPRFRSEESEGTFEFQAQQLQAMLAPSGFAERLVAEGPIQGRFVGSAPKRESRFSADRMAIEMEPGRGAPRLLTVGGNVTLEGSEGSESSRLETSELLVSFSIEGRASAWQLLRAETPASARVQWKDVAQATRATAQRLTAEFGPENRMRLVHGMDGVVLERRVGGGLAQQSTSREATVRFDSRGAWAEIEQAGSVQLRQDHTTAEADRSKLVRATETAWLEGSAVLSDAVSRTTAASATFNQRTSEIRGEGGVRTSYLRAEPDGVTNLGPQPATISSDRVLVNSQTGRVVYSGRARLWQGPAVLEADSIELLRDARQLVASGNLLGVFPGTANPIASPAAPRGASQPADLWQVRAGSLSYAAAEGRARLDRGVTAQSSQGRISAAAAEFFLSSTPGKARQVSRIVAAGGVTIRQKDRRAVSDRAEYTAGDGKFVLSGGKPTIYDGLRGTTTGRQLTFFLVDDRIVIDSEEGSRTLTRHRVEK